MCVRGMWPALVPQPQDAEPSPGKDPATVTVEGRRWATQQGTVHSFGEV